MAFADLTKIDTDGPTGWVVFNLACQNDFLGMIALLGTSIPSILMSMFSDERM